MPAQHYLQGLCRRTPGAINEKIQIVGINKSDQEENRRSAQLRVKPDSPSGNRMNTRHASSIAVQKVRNN
jgi:hypothetical protein